MAPQHQTVGAGMATPTPQTDADRTAQTKAQKELLERVTGHRDVDDKRTAALMTDSKLTTKEHVGKGKEPHKPDEQEALKVGSAQNAVDLKSVEVSSHESGEATDTVVTQPTTLEAGPHPLLHRDDALGTANVIAEDRGDKEKKGSTLKVLGKGPELKGAKPPKTVAEQSAENWGDGGDEKPDKSAKGKKH